MCQYCSFECWRIHSAGKHLKTGAYGECFQCGEMFYVRGYKMGRRAFCSQYCYAASRKPIPKTCNECRKKFIARSKTARFCSHKCSKQGTNNPNWRGGITKRIVSAEDNAWRIRVFERDGYICQECGVRGGQLQSHHIKPYADFPALRLDIDNGVTLCVPCHKKTPSYGIRGIWAKRTPAQRSESGRRARGAQLRQYAAIKAAKTPTE